MTVDSAAYLGAWPFRPLEGTIGGLRRMMGANGAAQAVVSPLEAFFHPDPQPVNARLIRRLTGRPGLWAAPIVNLKLADWRPQIEALSCQPCVRAVRLAPGFHDYPVQNAAPAVEAAAGRGLATVVQIRIQDERHHRRPIPEVAPVPLEAVVALAAAAPAARLIVSAARLPEMLSQTDQVRGLDNLWLDTSHLDGLDCVKRAADALGAARLLFSTCWPFFYARSAFLKLAEAQLPPTDADAIMAGNAARAFSPTQL